MSHTAIHHCQTGEIIFEGPFQNMADALETAIDENISLDYAALRHANLAHANLDGLAIRHADLSQANLTGANMSECTIESCDLSNSILHGTCLCETALRHVNFDGAVFGGADIAGASLINCRFSTQSAFSLNFNDAAEIANCRFKDIDDHIHGFSKPPVIIYGLSYPLTFLTGDIMLLGNEARPVDEWLARAHGRQPVRDIGTGRKYAFLRQNIGLIHAVSRRTGQSREEQTGLDVHGGASLS